MDDSIILEKDITFGLGESDDDHPSTVSLFQDNKTAGGSTGSSLSPEAVQQMVMLSVFMFIALIGNASVLAYLVLSRTKSGQRPVSIFVMSLAVTDLLITLFSMFPEMLWNAFGGEWLFGGVACKVVTYIQGMLFGSTSFILMAMSYDRYEAICKPMFLSRTTSRSRRMIASAYAFAAVMAILQPFVWLQVPDGVRADGSPKYKCASKGYSAQWQRQMYLTYLTFYIFVVPIIFVGVCYVRIAVAVWRSSKTHSSSLPTSGSSGALTLRRSTGHATDTAKVKTIKLTVCILFCYIICWSPYFAALLMKAFAEQFSKKYVPPVVRTISECMAWFSSCVNPLIYLGFNIPTQGLIDACCPKKAQTRMRLQDSPRPSFQPPSEMARSRRNTTVSLSSNTKEFRPQAVITTFSLSASDKYSLASESHLLDQDPRNVLVMI